jgi:RNA polymerase sigma-70 factor (ECF subfamily)
LRDLADNGAKIVSAEKSDPELLALTAAGDRGAFSELVRRHQGKVLKLAYGFTRDRQDCEELAQEIFFKAWRHAGSFRGEAAFSTWLYRLAVNCCLNHRQGRKARPDPQSLAGDLLAGTRPAADEMIAAEREAQLKKALDALPARQKMALVLASFEERSYEEIAAVMEASVPAVESLLFRARKNLAAILRPLKKKGEI